MRNEDQEGMSVYDGISSLFGADEGALSAAAKRGYRYGQHIAEMEGIKP